MPWHGGVSSGQVDISDNLDRSEADVRGIVHINGEPTSKEHDDAALKMQRVHRSKQAKKHVEGLREVTSTPRFRPKGASL